MKNILSQDVITATFREALRQGLVRPEDSLLMFHDLAFLEERIRNLVSLFPSSTLHGLAIKANPLTGILRHVLPLGAGVEAATSGEVRLALQCGYPPERIVYDSPVKTPEEIEFALRAGIRLNIDNFAELERIARIRETIPTNSICGIRINPQVGTGKILESSVAGEYSKFGIPFKTGIEALFDAFRKYPWLTGLHLHVGSQGCPLDLLIEGIRVLYHFMEEVNAAAGGNRIRQFDIGGGLPIAYHPGDSPPSMEDYVNRLKSEFPALFTAHCSLVTEFGRWVYTNAGWTVSRVEYVKQDPGIHTAMIHCGADLFVRECLNPKDWSHEYTVVPGHTGGQAEGRSYRYNLAGPLCFSGDILAKNVELPEIREGDHIIIHDTGGYTFSMWSRYNSRYTPRIFGYTKDRFILLRERETPEEVAAFWGR
jgi:diaminopimelate decarboxylase